MGQGWGQHVSHVQQLAPPARHPAAHATHPTTSPPPPAHAVQLGGGVVAVAPTRRRPKGVVHFLGGAFVAAVPHLTYPLLLERLADGGYTCIATPYPVTFQHVECAHAVHAAFEGALAQLRGGGGSGGGGGGALASWAAPRDAPVHGVGHSNGALLHLLVGSVCLPAAPAAAGANGSASINGSAADGSTGGDQGRPGRASNILISYNNLQVAEAVPVPLGVLQPAVQQLRGRGRLAATARQGLAQAAGAVGQLLALAESAAGGASPWQQQLQRQRQLLGSLQQWDPALIQLGSVFDEVRCRLGWTPCVQILPLPATSQQAGRHGAALLCPASPASPCPRWTQPAPPLPALPLAAAGGGWLPGLQAQPHRGAPAHRQPLQRAQHAAHPVFGRLN